jgi:predicted phage terminase large subunit-like protein
MIAISFDEKLTLSNSQYNKDIIKSAEYQELFGDLFQIRKDVDSKERFANNKGGERLSATTGANITGFGAEIIVVDDPQNPKTAESEVERENTIKYYTESLYNRLTPLNLGIRIVVQQRLHYEDLTGALLEKDADGYVHICLPAELSEHVKPAELRQHYKDGLLDPVRLSLVELGKLKKQGARYYAGQYLQIPTPDEGGIIKSEWFEIVDPATIIRDPVNEPIHFFIDSAYTEKTENDPTAILVCFKKNNTVYIADVIEVWKDFPNLKKFLIEYTNRFQHNEYSKMFIEEAASGLSIAQELRTISNLNVVGVKKPKDDKITRAHAITASLEGLKVKLVKGNYIENFLNQLKAFPNGKHDDMVDTLIMAVNELLINNNPDFLWLN